MVTVTQPLIAVGGNQGKQPSPMSGLLLDEEETTARMLQAECLCHPKTPAEILTPCGVSGGGFGVSRSWAGPSGWDQRPRLCCRVGAPREEGLPGAEGPASGSRTPASGAVRNTRVGLEAAQPAVFLSQEHGQTRAGGGVDAQQSHR